MSTLKDARLLWVAVWTVMWPAYARNVVDRLSSRECREFFQIQSDGAEMEAVDNVTDRLHLRMITSMEDTCPGGRYHVVGHYTNEIFTIPHLKLAYVVVRKVGSTTITQALRKAFNM